MPTDWTMRPRSSERRFELDSFYAAPRYWLASVYAAQGKVTEAIEQYRLFLGHAAKADADRAHALRALADLGASPQDSWR